MIYAAAFLIAFLIVLSFTPVLARLATRLDFTDKPTERKKHAAPVPLSGGVVMFLGFAVGFICLVARHEPKLLFVLAGSVMILCIGLADDYFKAKGREFPVAPRFITQLAAAALAFSVGIRFTGFFNPFTDSYILFPIGLQCFLTMLWIFGLTTVINFMDGLDGLAGGLCTLSGSTLFIVALVKGQSDSALMAALLVGATLGFLRHNLPPARVFMGDSGATLLGYWLGIISLHGAFKQATIISVFVPVLAMGVPIFDNILVVIRRLRAHQPAYQADTTQLHYRLIKTGMKPGQAVAFIVLLSACLNLTSIILLLVVHSHY